MRASRFKQRDYTDCGACCLGYIAAYYRKTLPVARLRQLAGTNHSGSTALGLVEAARALGFCAKGVRGAADALPTVPLPAVAHCLIDGRLLHYVVLTAWTAKRARVMDPAVGRVETWSPDRFKSIWTGVLILIAPGDTFQTGNECVPLSVRLWQLLRPHRGLLLQAFVGAVVATLLALSMSVYVQKVVDNVIPDASRPLLNLLGLIMLALLVFRLLLGVFQALLSLRMAQHIDAALILAYYRHLLRLPQPFFDAMRVGEITSRIGDAVKVRNFLNQSLLSLMLNPLILIFALFAMFLYSWRLGLLSLAIIPPNAALYWLTNRLNRAYQRRLMERAADFDAQLVESLAGESTVRRFGLEELANLKTETRLVQLLRTTWRAAIANVGTGTGGSFLTQGYQIALLWIGASLVLDSALSPGELMSCFTLAGYLTGPLTSLIGLNTSIQDALVATDRLFEIMDLEVEEDRGTIELSSGPPIQIRFENVAFKYPGRMTTLQDFTVTCPAQCITVFTGASGCGKSTLLSLLQRLYLPTSGRILLGEHDLRYYSLSSLRRAIAVVPQQTFLFAGTVLENLAPADPHPDIERLLVLCRELEALSFIERLPHGIYTHLNENGSNLSGGQRQRIAVIRALYRDAPVLLLDEPDAALDLQAARCLCQALLRRRSKGTTILIAAHGDTLVSIADQVVQLADGGPASTRRIDLERDGLPNGSIAPHEGEVVASAT